MEKYHFFAKMSRMKHINRWMLMRNTSSENLSEHSFEVSIIAHALAIIAKEKYNECINPEEVAAMGLYHDCAEILTGDMPTPIKYHNRIIREAYKEIELAAEKTMLSYLPDYMQAYLEDYLIYDVEKDHEWRLVKAADKICALIKCIQERMAGNTEFTKAEQATRLILKELDCKEAYVFIQDFLPSYSLTIDEQE